MSYTRATPRLPSGYDIAEATTPLPISLYVPAWSSAGICIALTDIQTSVSRPHLPWAWRWAYVLLYKGEDEAPRFIHSDYTLMNKKKVVATTSKLPLAGGAAGGHAARRSHRPPKRQSGTTISRPLVRFFNPDTLFLLQQEPLRPACPLANPGEEGRGREERGEINTVVDKVRNRRDVAAAAAVEVEEEVEVAAAVAATAVVC
ncbi:hypothetical protein E2C01_033716 [Portunus trituberculatus]|uniref:Uncharacterized protein n=1 Tax=Portunus trituberculatus TaxID=210409 RepID=A0A5B7EZJ9_PORTR|nr:hypothetical protein [Portunus trituberculatus]